MYQVSFKVFDGGEDVELGFLKNCDGLRVGDVSWVGVVYFVASAEGRSLEVFLIVDWFWSTFLEWRFWSEEV